MIKQLVNKSASADLRAIKQLSDIVQGAERRSEAASAPPAPASFRAAVEEVIAELKKRIERDIRAKIAAENARPAVVTPVNASLAVTPADPWSSPRMPAAGQDSASSEAAPSACSPGRACLGQAAGCPLSGNEE